jgi:hypothetical protein
MRLMYHIPQNSFYVEIVRIKYENNEYIKAHIRYYSKSSLTLFAETRNQKLYRKVMAHWEKQFV